MKGTEEYGDID